MHKRKFDRLDKLFRHEVGASVGSTVITLLIAFNW